MSTVTALEAERHFSDLLERVSHGEEVVITKADKPVARIIPDGEKPRDLAEVREAMAGLRALRAEIASRPGAKPLTHAEVKAMIEEGRR